MSNGDAAGNLSAPADFIDFSQHGGVGSFQEILANAARIGRDVVITLGADVLTLENGTFEKFAGRVTKVIRSDNVLCWERNAA